MGEPVEEVRFERKEVRRQTTPATVGGASAYGLPPELVNTAVGRLGFLGLVIALMGPSAYLIELATQPERVASDGFPFQQVVPILLFAAGSVMCVLAWRRLVRAELLVDIGLVFEVVVAFLISLSESATPWPEKEAVRGVSWNCLWISMYVVAVPGTYGKSILAAISAACMAPFGLLVATVVNNNPVPSAEQLMVLLLPPYAVAAWAIPVARHLNRLGAQVSKARAMGSYELLDMIGQGGMGEVWRARHRMLARVSAIKLIRPEILGLQGREAENLLRRFEREARATAALTSPHTVSLYDYGTSEDGSFYYAMELLDGVDLETLVREFGPVPAGRATHFLRQAAKSLTEAHDHGLVHRDIKPRNIFTCRLGAEHDFVKLLDFGLVKVRETSDLRTQLTREGMTTGTPAYMAPEVGTGSPNIDGRADLYSLGCVGYWLLTGQLVFDAPTPMAMVFAHVQTPPPPPSTRTEMEIPPALESVILRCLQKNPADRPAGARELSDLLSACDGIPLWTEEDAEHWWLAHLPRKHDDAMAAQTPASEEITR